MTREDPIFRPHDLFARQSLERLEVARSIVRHYLPGELVRKLNMDTLTLVSESFIDSELRASQSDVLYHVQFTDGHWGQIYILFEHKSYSDPMTVFQLLKYVVRIWERQQRQQESLTPVIPFVLYHGEHSWTAARSLRELVGGPALLQRYVPDFAIELLDLSTYPDDQLPTESLTRATLLLLKYIFREDLRGHLEEIFRAAAQKRGEEGLLEVLRSFLTYVAAAARQLEMRDLAPVVKRSLGTTGENLVSTILQHWIEQGREEGREQGREAGREAGRQEGREEGRIAALRAGVREILDVRFPGTVTALAARIDSIESADLLQQALRLCATAQSASEFEQWLSNHE